MKVLLVASGKIPVPPPDYGAVERHVAELAAALRARGHDVEVLAPVLGGRAREFRVAWRARRRFRAGGFDVLHAHTTGVAAGLAALGVPFAYTSHSRHWRTVEGPRERAGFALERYACARASALVALTPEVRDAMLEAGIPGAVVVPNGVDASRFDVPRAHAGFRVLCLGEVRPHKGMHVAAVAAQGLGEVRVVGPVRDPPYATRLEEAGARVLGVLSEEDLREEFATADVFAHLSTSEALSLAVLEAMAAGLPLVASDVCVGQVEDGVNGFAVRAGDDDARVAAARAAFGRLAADAGLRARMGVESRRLATERFAWDAVAAKVEAAYRSADRKR